MLLLRFLLKDLGSPWRLYCFVDRLASGILGLQWLCV